MLFSAAAIQRLLKNTEGANIQSFKPTLIIGWTWRKFVEHSLKVQDETGTYINHLALITNGISDSCPSPHTIIKNGSTILIIAQNRIDWRKFEHSLSKISK